MRQERKFLRGNERTTGGEGDVNKKNMMKINQNCEA
jgi:hypothetical protein